MSVVEELLGKHSGNKTRAAVELTVGLNRGDPATFKQGYSIGSALMASIDAYNLVAREVALVTEALPLAITEHSSPTMRPLVIVHVGGGMVQWTREKQGLGTPRVIVLDFDKEGADDEELVEFRDLLREAIDQLKEYRDDADADVITTLTEAYDEYVGHVADGTQPSRYR